MFYEAIFPAAILAIFVLAVLFYLEQHKNKILKEELNMMRQSIILSNPNEELFKDLHKDIYHLHKTIITMKENQNITLMAFAAVIETNIFLQMKTFVM
jgi:uncharacterized membrane protein YhiD involved in acid resistance